jgi:hypothetical protein
VIPEDLRFRVVTRFRAIGYWLREKGGIVGGAIAAGAKAVDNFWSSRSEHTKNTTFAVAGVLVVYLIVKFIPVPGIPCEIGAKECAPDNNTIAFVPQDSLLYAHLTVNSDSHQAELARDLGDELPNFAAVLQSAGASLATPTGKPIDITHAVLPWVKDDLALFEISQPKKAIAATAYIAGVDDSDKANQFLTGVGGGAPKPAKQNGAVLSVYPSGFASARAGDELIFGSEAAVRAALDARSGKAPRLEDSDLDAARDDLPDIRVAEVYLSRDGVQRTLAGRPGTATQLDTFVDYGATKAMAASATIKDDGVEINVVSELDPALEQKSPTVFADLPEFTPGLADETGPDAFGLINVGQLGPALERALATPGPGGQGLAGALQALGQRLQQEAGVDPLKGLLPALGGQAALVAEPADPVPYASLIVDNVDEARANQVLSSLQAPLLKSASASGNQVPTFQSQELDGVTVHSLQISPLVNLSYATHHGALVISTQPEGITQIFNGGSSLAGTDAYKDATEHLPDRVSALVFLNLDEILRFPPVTQTLAVNPLYASLSEDTSHLQSLAVGVRGSNEELRSEMFLSIND